MRMLKHILAMAAVLTGSAFVLAAATTNDDAKKSSGPTTAPSTQPINAHCAVEPEDPVDPALTVVYKGQVIGFCCDHCVPKFNKDPEKYMKNLKKD